MTGFDYALMAIAIVFAIFCVIGIARCVHLEKSPLSRTAYIEARQHGIVQKFWRNASIVTACVLILLYRKYG